MLSWFLPWLYSYLLPVAGSEPYLAYSPISNGFVVSEQGNKIYSIDKDNNPIESYTVEQRDSLLPHQYFNQLMARDRLPDTIAGIAVSIPTLKHAQWVFQSTPRDLNKVLPKVYMMMESMPARIDLEDPKEVFRLNGKVEFVNMESNTVNPDRSARFTKAFEKAGFQYPEKWMSANVTTRKQYDEGYLMIDAAGDLYHMKQQAGRPYIVKIQRPNPDFKAEKAFIFENMDRSNLGYVVDADGNSYLLKHDGYRLVQLPVEKIDPTKNRITIVGTLFNIMVRFNNQQGTRWYALDNAGTHDMLGNFNYTYSDNWAAELGEYIFPYELSYTAHTDCLVHPRIGFISWKAIYLNIALALLLAYLGRHRRRRCMIAGPVITLIFGLYSFIPFAIIKE